MTTTAGRQRTTRVHESADEFFAEGLTFQNTIDSRSGVKGGQAAALRVDADRAIFYKCRITGFQDTYYTGGNKRSYHKECVIEGTTDFIYGNGIALFEDCIINSRKNSHITAHSQKLIDGKPANKFGYVFKNCKLKAYPGEEVTSASLGRPWGNGARVVYLNCSMGPHIRKEGWSIWKGRSNHETAYYAEYKNSGPGYAPDDRLAWTHQLTDEEAAIYTKENIFKADSTTATDLKNDWNPVIADRSERIQNKNKERNMIRENTNGRCNTKTSTLWLSIAIFALIANIAVAESPTVPSFPGAEGYGAMTIGGRGGKVIAVTNLDESGPGSLRAAFEAKGPRIVVFKVSGTIDADLKISNDHITVAGQTAPGDGVTIRGNFASMPTKSSSDTYG